ncbi:MAG TPA: ABC transporter ATP-binding protein [Pirellulaceae bacterium]|nr:ABC transporter ATP-binding protein [Pirellulaceae bacterium]
MVVTEHLTKSYGAFRALSDCNLNVQSGEVFGLLGPNGAGKSTLLRLLLGFLTPTSGRALIDGLDCYRQRVQVHRRASYVPGDARLFRTMRGKQVLRFFARIRPEGSYKRSLEIADRLDLDLDAWVMLMSTGMRQKLALAACLASEQPLLILDEPTANLDPTVRATLLQMIAEARRDGRTVIFSSHVLSEVEDVCDRVAILRAGCLVHQQVMSALKEQHRIVMNPRGLLPALPAALATDAQWRELDHGRVQLDIRQPLVELLDWLASAPIADVQIQPLGLRAVYDRFHLEPNGLDEV